LIKRTPIDDLETLNLGTLLKDAHRRRRHRAWEYTPNVSVVPPRGGKKDDVVRGRVKDGRDDGDVWEVRSAGVRRVGHEHVPVFERLAV